jgi:hypothetical protein
MEIVLKRLEVMMLGVDKFIDVGGLGLTELPESDLWSAARIVNCSRNKLKSLPRNLTSVIVLHCSNNEIESLPDNMFKIEYALCSDNRLTTLPNMPTLERLYCGNNPLTHIPALPNIKILYCFNNLLTILPDVPKDTQIRCDGNRFHYNPRYYKRYWVICKVTTLTMVVRRWRRTAMVNARERKRDLHAELLYSPDLPFYRRTPEALHWFEMTISRGYYARLNKK